MRTATPLRTWSRITARSQVGHLGGDLDAAVHRARVHDDGLVGQAVEPGRGEAVAGRVLAQDRAAAPRSCRSRCMRSRQTTSTCGEHGVEVVATPCTGQPSRLGGSSVGGATRVTSAPRAV